MYRKIPRIVLIVPMIDRAADCWNFLLLSFLITTSLPHVSYLLCIVQFTLLVSLVYFFSLLFLRKLGRFPEGQRTECIWWIRRIIPALGMPRWEGREFQAKPVPHSESFTHKTNTLPFPQRIKKPRNEKGKVPDIHMLGALLEVHHSICVSLLHWVIRRGKKEQEAEFLLPWEG